MNLEDGGESTPVSSEDRCIKLEVSDSVEEVSAREAVQTSDEEQEAEAVTEATPNEAPGA